MPRHRDNDELRDVVISTRWTKAEAARVDALARAGESRSSVLRRLVAQADQDQHIRVTCEQGRAVVTREGMAHILGAGDTIVLHWSQTLSEN